MGKYSQLGKNTLFVFIGNVGGKALAILMLPLYTRWLSVSDFGVVDLITTYSTLLMGIVSLSISEAVFIFPKNQKKEVQSCFFTSALFFSILSITISLTIFFLIGSCFWDLNNTIYKRKWLIIILVFAMFMQSCTQQYTRSINKIKVYSFSGIVLSVSIILFSFLLIPSYGVNGYIIAWGGAYMVTALFSVFFSGAFLDISIYNVKWENYKEMLKYTVPLIPNGIMFWLMNSLNRPLLEDYCGLEAVGIFALANKIPLIFSSVFNIFLISWQISVLDEYGQEGYMAFFNRMLRLIEIGLGAFLLFISLFNQVIICILSTQNYESAWHYVSLLTYSAYVFSISAFISANFLATKESKYFLYSSLIGASFSILGNYLLIPLFKIYGACISIIIASVSMLICRYSFLKKSVEVKDIAHHLLMLVILGAFAAIATFEDSYIKYSLLIITFLGLYAINREKLTEYKSILFGYITKRKIL